VRSASARFFQDRRLLPPPGSSSWYSHVALGDLIAFSSTPPLSPDGLLYRGSLKFDPSFSVAMSPSLILSSLRFLKTTVEEP